MMNAAKDAASAAKNMVKDAAAIVADNTREAVSVARDGAQKAAASAEDTVEKAESAAEDAVIKTADAMESAVETVSDTMEETAAKLEAAADQAEEITVDEEPAEKQPVSGEESLPQQSAKTQRHNIMYNAESRTWSFLTLHILLLYFIGNCILRSKKALRRNAPRYILFHVSEKFAF